MMQQRRSRRSATLRMQQRRSDSLSFSDKWARALGRGGTTDNLSSDRARRVSRTYTRDCAYTQPHLEVEGKQPTWRRETNHHSNRRSSVNGCSVSRHPEEKRALLWLCSRCARMVMVAAGTCCSCRSARVSAHCTLRRVCEGLTPPRASPSEDPWSRSWGPGRTWIPCRRDSR